MAANHSVVYRGFLARRWELVPLTPGVSDWQAQNDALPRNWGVWGGASRQRLRENLGVNEIHFSMALTTFSTLSDPTQGMQPGSA